MVYMKVKKSEDDSNACQQGIEDTIDKDQQDAGNKFDVSPY